MAKVTFSARKDPLLPTRPATPDRPPPSTTSDSTQTPQSNRPDRPAQKRTRSRRAMTARNGHGIEEPAGVIAIDTAASTAPSSAPKHPLQAVDSAKPTASRPEHPRNAGRRVQTSISLPPDVWDTLDELGEGSGVSRGELLTAILTGAVPASAQDALTALEQLLVDIAPDDGPHEERNYRLPLALRAQLDALVKALGSGPRAQRSLLIRALLATHTPPDVAHARELITTRRIDAMRSAMLAADD